MRPAGQIKMGYYPTPDKVVGRIKAHLGFPSYAKAAALDPCCGEGLALHALCEGRDIVTYGIELDGIRAQSAVGRLGRAVHAGYEEVDVPSGSMGLLFLNPPYDDNEGERKELTFLRDTYGTLVRGGVLVYIVPAKRLSPDVAALLAANFDRISVHRFPDPEFSDFGQVVVFGRRTAWPKESPDEARRLLDAVRAENLREIPEQASETYAIPTTPQVHFEKRGVALSELKGLLAESPLWGRLSTLIDTGDLGKLANPPTPLHVGHLGLLLAAGRLNGVVGSGPDRHIVAGRPEKHIVESEETEEDGEGNSFKVHKRLESFRVAIKILKPTGEIVKLV
jgi:hypothetical protein